MDAVRNEILTGKPTNGLWHTEKAESSINALKNWLRANEKTASAPDVRWARALLRDLKDALATPKP